jgi:uncharacterized protein YcbX
MKMYVAEIWRYPVKSMAGEQLREAEVSATGIVHDREVGVAFNGRVLTARRYPNLLALHGSINTAGVATVNGFPWNSLEALGLTQEAVGKPAQLIQFSGPERFDVLPLLVATDGAIAYLNVDRRRFRPNILIAGVDGLEERSWPGRRVRIGEVAIQAAQLRRRCVMTTYDPDSQQQEPAVLKRIVEELDGTLALDCAVLVPGRIRVADPVELV